MTAGVVRFRSALRETVASDSGADVLLAVAGAGATCALAGVWPLASYRNASFMRNEVPGVVIPDWIMERMAAVTSRDDQLRTGIEIARESVARVRSGVAGIQVSAPLGRVDSALAVIEE